MAVLALVGPTASGKSSLALEVAASRTDRGAPTELVAVDAFTAYRHLDIATAKPTAADRAEAPHHLVDVLDPWEELSIASFRQLARDAIEDIRHRGATPLLVGGSGLYFRAVVDDLDLPPTDEDVRARIHDRWVDDPPAAHAHLASIDPAAAAKIDPGNLRRTVRALEVIELTGVGFSSYDDGWDRYDSIYPDLDVAYLEPPAAELKTAIQSRAEAMVDAGLLDEAVKLRQLGRPLSRTATQAIGYAEAFAVLDGELPEEELAVTIATRTWRFAKRQRAWFRSDPRCRPTARDDVLARWR